MIIYNHSNYPVVQVRLEDFGLGQWYHAHLSWLGSPIESPQAAGIPRVNISLSLRGETSPLSYRSWSLHVLIGSYICNIAGMKVDMRSTIGCMTNAVCMPGSRAPILDTITFNNCFCFGVHNIQTRYCVIMTIWCRSYISPQGYDSKYHYKHIFNNHINNHMVRIRV